MSRVLRDLIVKTPTQKQMMRWLGTDLSYAEIGSKVGCTERAARYRVAGIIDQNVAAGIVPAGTGRMGLAVHATLVAHGIRVLKGTLTDG